MSSASLYLRKSHAFFSSAIRAMGSALLKRCCWVFIRSEDCIFTQSMWDWPALQCKVQCHIKDIEHYLFAKKTPLKSELHTINKSLPIAVSVSAVICTAKNRYDFLILCFFLVFHYLIFSIWIFFNIHRTLSLCIKKTKSRSPHNKTNLCLLQFQ